MNKKTVTTRVWIENAIPSIEQEIDSIRQWIEQNQSEIDRLLEIEADSQEDVSNNESLSNRTGVDGGEDILSRYQSLSKKSANLSSIADKLRALIDENSGEFIGIEAWQWVGLVMSGYEPDNPFREKQEKWKKTKDKIETVSIYIVTIALFYFMGAAMFGWLLVGLSVFGAAMFFYSAFKASPGNMLSGVILVPILICFVFGVALVGIDALLSVF